MAKFDKKKHAINLRKAGHSILDISKNDPITITGIATPANTIDNPITL